MSCDYCVHIIGSEETTAVLSPPRKKFYFNIEMRVMDSNRDQCFTLQNRYVCHDQNPHTSYTDDYILQGEPRHMWGLCL